MLRMQRFHAAEKPPHRLSADSLLDTGGWRRPVIWETLVPMIGLMRPVPVVVTKALPGLPKRERRA